MNVECVVEVPKGNRTKYEVDHGEPTFPGCLVTVRPVALFDMSDENRPDTKVVRVPTA